MKIRSDIGAITVRRFVTALAQIILFGSLSSLFFCLFSSVAPNMLQNVFEDLVSTTLAERGSHMFFRTSMNAASFSDDSYISDMKVIQEKYPTSVDNCFIKGRAFPMYGLDTTRNSISIYYGEGNVGDISLIPMPSYYEHVSYLGTRLTVGSFLTIDDGTSIYISKKITTTLFGEESYSTILGKTVTLAVNGQSHEYTIRGITESTNIEDQTKSIEALSSNNLVFVSESIIPSLKKEIITFEISNSRCISTNEIRNSNLAYINDILAYYNKHGCNDFTLFSSSQIGTTVALNSQLSVSIQKSIDFHNSPEQIVLSIVYFLLWLGFFIVFAYFLFKKRKLISTFFFDYLVMISVTFFTILTVVLPKIIGYSSLFLQFQTPLITNVYNNYISVFLLMFLLVVFIFYHIYKRDIE